MRVYVGFKAYYVGPQITERRNWGRGETETAERHRVKGRRWWWRLHENRSHRAASPRRSALVLRRPPRERTNTPDLKSAVSFSCFCVSVR